MKAKVIKGFRDKYTGVVYKEGDVIEVTKARFDEILTVDKLVEAVVEEKPEKAPEEPVKKPKKTAKKKAE